MTSRAGTPSVIRPRMDVFSAYQNQYIGSVVAVMQRTDDSVGAQDSGSNPTRSEPRLNSVSLVHEEGNVAGQAEHRGERRLGEDMGPVPTSGYGNTGPITQSASRAYATHPEDVSKAILYLVIRPGRLNLGPLTRPVYIPWSAVGSISMDRVVLGMQREDIPAEWGRRP